MGLAEMVVMAAMEELVRVELVWVELAWVEPVEWEAVKAARVSQDNQLPSCKTSCGPYCTELQFHRSLHM